jgi:hypothetical protein
MIFPQKKNRVVPSIRADLPDLRRPSGKLKLPGREENENGGNGDTLWDIYMGYIVYVCLTFGDIS